MAKFTADKKKNLVLELQEWKEEARVNARINQKWDIAFKVALVLLALGATTCSILIAGHPEPLPSWLPTTSAIFTGFSTVLSAFAFTQFNFTAKQRSWTVRANKCLALLTELKYEDPEVESFNPRMMGLLDRDPDDLEDNP